MERSDLKLASVTRGLDHASRIYPTCALTLPKSGKPDFGWSIFFARSIYESDGLPGQARSSPAMTNGVRPGSLLRSMPRQLH